MTKSSNEPESVLVMNVLIGVSPYRYSIIMRYLSTNPSPHQLIPTLHPNCFSFCIFNDPKKAISFSLSQSSCYLPVFPEEEKVYFIQKAHSDTSFPSTSTKIMEKRFTQLEEEIPEGIYIRSCLNTYHKYMNNMTMIEE